MTPSEKKQLTNFTANLDAELRRRDWTDTELTERSGVYRGRFSKWRNGEGSPTLSHLIRLSDALGLPIDAIARGIAGPPAIGSEQKILLDLVFAGTNPIGLSEALRRLATGHPSPPEPVEAPLVSGPIVRKKGRPRRQAD